MDKHICGDKSKAVKPSMAHISWHKRRGTAPCGRARKEASLYQLRRQYGPGWEPVRNMDGYQCGTAEDAGAPSSAHYAWHRRQGEEPCGKAIREHSLVGVLRRLGEIPEGYEPVSNHRGGYECDSEEAATVPSTAHYEWHRRQGDEPCGMSRWEYNWATAERKHGQPIPDWKPYGWDTPTCVYQISFVDGDRYYGITSHQPELRWREHANADTPVGRKIRSGVIFVTEVLCVAPNRRMAMEVETMAIKAGNPWGNLLNIYGNEHAERSR